MRTVQDVTSQCATVRRPTTDGYESLIHFKQHIQELEQQNIVTSNNDTSDTIQAIRYK